jgi:hypothetical protein
MREALSLARRPPTHPQLPLRWSLDPPAEGARGKLSVRSRLVFRPSTFHQKLPGAKNFGSQKFWPAVTQAWRLVRCSGRWLRTTAAIEFA